MTMREQSRSLEKVSCATEALLSNESLFPSSRRTLEDGRLVVFESPSLRLAMLQKGTGMRELVLSKLKGEEWYVEHADLSDPRAQKALNLLQERMNVSSEVGAVDIERTLKQPGVIWVKAHNERAREFSLGDPSVRHIHEGATARGTLFEVCAAPAKRENGEYQLHSVLIEASEFQVVNGERVSLWAKRDAAIADDRLYGLVCPSEPSVFSTEDFELLQKLMGRTERKPPTAPETAKRLVADWGAFAKV